SQRKILDGILAFIRRQAMDGEKDLLDSLADLGEDVIVLGLLDPFPGGLFHRGPFPGKQSSSGTTRPPPAATPFPSECERSDQPETALPAASGCGPPGRAGSGPA